ncbi:cytochrome P460 family protein [Psychroserpens jangbogonensis]|uniref:cytochrome P460 family protein n=1 Tax=Psychroserpens jangbogonensis TaxID=1484460 RepID=UPI0009DF584F|nr:cytochrome P460 family protein [Psychroserpens jangbogonensis]
MKLKKIYKVIVLVSIVTCFITSCKNEGEGYQDISYFKMNTEGDLERPQDYRSWVYVGTPVTPNDMNDGKAAFPELHNVYMDPMSYDHWKKTGTWRDGTILVKELVSVGTKAAVSGNGYFMGEFIGLEATIKSSKHFPDEPGNWAYFSFTNPKGGDLADTGKAFETQMCNSCHNASAADDFVFTQYYPVLSAAKGVGENITPENAARRTAAQAKAFSDAGVWDAMAPTPEGLTLEIPLGKEQLFAYLKSGKYKSYSNKEATAHPSLGPHQKLGLPVRVFMNDIIAKSLEEGNNEHPLGSVIVKEMFTADNQPNGWAIMAKTHDKSDGGNGWFWYEVTDDNDADKIAAIGNGVEGCVSCHTIGRDMVRTSFPLK